MGDSQEQSDASQPNWDVLPHDPQAFFGLAEGFDRRDLKRSYSKLIRVYKPERHPAEFQRIRAAYEQLDRELRYGRSVETAKLPAQRWDEIAAATEQEDRDEQPTNREKPTKRRSVPEQLVDRVLSESPQRVYDEIAERADKSPYDYYCLAVLSDLLKPRKTTRFSRWLVKGIEAHPFEPNLLYLLREDLTRTAREADLPDLLEACAKAVPRDDYFALTEPAWERLLRTIPFTEFVGLLERCEAHLRDISISYRVTFMMRVLRHAVWSGEREWVDEAFAFVEQNFQEIPPALENEIELLAAVAHYTALREQFLEHRLGGKPLREQMDNALRQYMTQEAAIGDQAVLEVQLAILEDPTAAITSFPHEDDEAVAAFYHAWAWAASDVGERYGTTSSQIDGRLWQEQYTDMLLDCDKSARKLGPMKRLNKYEWVHLFAVICGGLMITIAIPTLTVLFVISLRLQPSSRETSALMWSGAFSLLFAILMVMMLSSKARAKIIDPISKVAKERAYQQVYRHEAAKFLQQFLMPFYTFRQFEQPTWMKEPYHARLQNDLGLAIYSLALPLAT